MIAPGCFTYFQASRDVFLTKSNQIGIVFNVV